ncbi:MAG: hypothetical protein WC919_00810 [Candidatus Paceibacterota bacterium]|jgi:hypothetical protein
MNRDYWLDQAELQLQQTGDDYNEADVSSLADAMMIENQGGF